MVNDRKITITVGASRNSTDWRPQVMLLSELWERLRTPARGTETVAEYIALSKGEQDRRKDVGGYVAGTIDGPRRKASAVTGRDVLTLDLDSIPNGGTDTVCARVAALGCGYCIYSTRKHRPDAPRLRVLVPLDRTVTPDEYVPIARRLAEIIGMELADPSTFEPSRLMYWPSCCADGQYVYYTEDKPLLSADGMLATYANWHDVTSWPTCPGAMPLPRLAAKQGDPEGKRGIVGAFCRIYDVPAAMDKFLPGVYDETTTPGRYTFTGGTTTGGAVLYDEGKFLYSHHATDPCGGRLVNAFDLVRLHRFGDLDDEASAGTPTNRLPSYTAMCELASSDAQVSGLLMTERWETATSGFQRAQDGEEGGEGQNNEWLKKLRLNSHTGLPLATIDNVWEIMEHDPALRGKFALNTFSGRGEVLGPLPWSKEGRRRAWEDNDNAGMYWYMERVYGITGNGKIDGALSLHSTRHAFNDVQAYLGGLTWDGVERLDTLLIDYLGAEDTDYTRAVTRKSFTAAVARVMEPGTKFDQMLIMSGPQGIGKSTLLDKMSRGWFNDSIRTFEGKEASELLQGVWLVEVSELEAFRRTDVARIKQFISQRADRFRAAYGRHVKEMPRCCVFFGTTNASEYLTDRTGNRRFWPVEVGVGEVKRNVWEELGGEVDQLWAEAKARWAAGEELFLKGELDKAAAKQQERHREADAAEGLVLDWLEKPVPEDWEKWGIEKRRLFWSGAVAGDLKLVPRDRVCAAEVWCELFNAELRNAKNSDAARINAIIEASGKWGGKRARRCGPYGVQKGFGREPKIL